MAGLLVGEAGYISLEHWSSIRSRAPGAMSQIRGIAPHGGRPVCSLQSASASGRHMKQPRAGEPGDHSSKGEQGG
eukprot:1640594-Pyramimonas_sp.AAC.1